MTLSPDDLDGLGPDGLGSDELGRLIGALRAEGLSVPIDAVLLLARGLTVSAARAESLYWVARITLVRQHGDLDRFDRGFARFLARVESPGNDESDPASVPVMLETGDDDDGADATESTSADPTVMLARASRVEVLRHRDLATLTDEERLELDRLLAAVELRGSLRVSRRRRPHGGRTGPIDLRRTMAAARRTGGEPMRLHRSRRRRVPRRLLLLLDVSGSMSDYSRSLIRIAHAAVGTDGRVEVFTLGTRLTRLTPHMRMGDPERSLTAVAEAVPDWSGGTRLGECLARFNREWGARGPARGADVVILSDGWERDDPARLGRELGRLAQVANRIIWVNPLKVTDGYEPLAKGMAAALPHLDEFVEGHSADSFARLAELLDGRSRRRTGARS